ncbi:MAG: GNAT family N-acetyltransferase [Cyanomargarita calcarea GSE-NOS-MK-12-04C]|jgi:predicted N-acetyltransferase YhbS|uniref:GNAT family N-acetyltransferase n=1 Tax=Cyanomargarita calcarea GSE-NOS-MK-12-04C TaxID=2839659 RepID=A0A951QXF1_9CYAN|nr:GNAT family N-acetyltransferase [Cyanomargarita calcarea GSE-NOS-MK-12-04C]
MDCRVVATLSENQILELVDLYKNEFWSQKRTHQDVVKMLAGSDIIVALVDEKENIIAFTRVLTDFVYRAMIFDVIVKPSHRNMGLGAKLMNEVMNHPQLKSVEQFAVYCLPEMIPFYERWGFTSDVGEIRLMYTKNPIL